MALSAVQTIALLALSASVFDSGQRTQEMAQALADLSAAATAPGATAQRRIDAQEIRALIREEVAHSGRASPSRPTASAHPSKPPVQNPTRAADVARLENQLNAYLARGDMSASEMAAFQSALEDLPAEERGKLLRQLTSAMHTGALDAQL